MIWSAGVFVLKGGASIIYTILKLLPVQKKLVLISRLNEESSIDFQCIISRASENYPDIEVVVLNHKMYRPITHILDVLVEMYHLATSQACIVESYVISVSILHHRPSFKVIQIWHALGAVKAFGHLAINKPEGSSLKVAKIMHMHRNYTYVTAGSTQTVRVFAEAFNVPQRDVLPIGMPRVDYLLDGDRQKENRDRIREYYGIARDRQVVLYAPTFRKSSKIPYSLIIEAASHERFTLIIKQHPHDKSIITSKKNVIVDTSFDLLDLLPVSDAVITDYSATVFEAALLKKPLFFWLFDKGRYEKRRGFAMNIESLPGVKSESIQEILMSIEEKTYNLEEVSAFAKKYVSLQDGTSTAKILNVALGEKV